MFFKDYYDKLTSWVAYCMSGFGVVVSQLTFEQWYFAISMVIGVLALGLNWWHKRAIQLIAREQGVRIGEFK